MTASASSGAASGSGGLASALAAAAQTFVTTAIAVVACGFVGPVLGTPDAYLVTPSGTVAARIAVAGEPATRNDPDAVPLVFRLEPPLVVMMTDGGSWRYLELHVQLQARTTEALSVAKQNEPAIHAGILNALYGRDASMVVGRAELDALRRECLAEAQRILVRETGAAQIDDLFFTAVLFQ
jgi:flagellar basal body-associated protein FliL